MRRIAASTLAISGIAAIALAGAVPAHADTTTELTVLAENVVDINGEYNGSVWGGYSNAVPNGPLELPFTIPANTWVPIDDPDAESYWGAFGLTVPAPAAACTREVNAFSYTVTIPQIEDQESYISNYAWVYGIRGEGPILFTEDDVTVTPEIDPATNGGVGFSDDEQPYLYTEIFEYENESFTHTVRIALPEPLPFDKVAGAFEFSVGVVDLTFEDFSFEVTDTCEEDELAATGAEPSTALLIGGAAAVLGAAGLMATAIRRGSRTATRS